MQKTSAVTRNNQGTSNPSSAVRGINR